MGELRFDGRVALVTGAGGSIGRAHAMLLASRGAKLVINDYNTTISGDRSADTDNPGTRVVKEIRDMGGGAVFNGDSVADPAGAALHYTYLAPMYAMAQGVAMEIGSAAGRERVCQYV